MAINDACNELNQNWMESGVSENAVNGHIQFMKPGETACYSCAPPIAVASNLKILKREGVCAASLPTTMGIISGLLVQNALKYLLNFGNVSYYLGYNALLDYFPTMTVKPNKSCKNKYCKLRQSEFNKRIVKLEIKEEKEDVIVHDDNEWNIELVSESLEENDKMINENLPKLGKGVEYEFTRNEDLIQPTEENTTTKIDIPLSILIDELDNI